MQRSPVAWFAGVYVSVWALLAGGCAPAVVDSGDSGDSGTPIVDSDGDGTADAADCNPDDPRVHADATEWCDGLDNDCDGAVDESFDLDADGYLTDSVDCRALGGATDCDDGNPDIHPGAAEACNDVDDDCSGVVDDAPDEDGDGTIACDDCDDQDRYTNPDAPDACDGIDNNCDGIVDEGFDGDGDGVSPCAGDCDDLDPAISPLAAEVCDGLDNNCDGAVDELKECG